MTHLAGNSEPVDFAHLSSFSFDITLDVAHERQSWFMSFCDSDWAPDAFMGKPLGATPPTRLLVDESPVIYEDEIEDFPPFKDFLTLGRTLMCYQPGRELEVGCAILMRGLQKFVEPFVPSFRELQGVLHLCNAIVAGSFLVVFLLGKMTDELEMDIFVPLTPHSYAFKVMLSYLKQKGYSFYDEGQIHEDLGDSTVLRVFKLYREDTVRFVNVVESSARNGIHLLTEFKCSVACNAFSSRHILVMFPQWTDRRKSWAPSSVPSRARHKYEEYGIEFVSDNTEWTKPCGDLCPALRRGIYREGTSWLIPLSPSWRDLESKEFPLLEQWRGQVQCTNTCCGYCAYPLDVPRSDFVGSY